MKRRSGFTLVELMIVVVIISILMGLILRAVTSGVRVAEEKATIALIAKLDQAMQDRVDALSTYQAEPNRTHYLLGGMWPTGAGPDPTTGLSVLLNTQRAQVIAQFDYLRAQLPDVFAKQSNTLYPFNFAGAQWNGITGDLAAQLPLGNSVAIANGGCGLSPGGTGIYGASYEIAAGIYKQLGYGPKGYDGNDNDGDGLVDERDEGNLGLSAAEIATIDTRINNHNHKTARSEMLYAILVEGGGTLGSAFDRDDFTSKEVMDTDGDGLMEFVDAWGEPLQFYRWPILFHSDTQKGFPDIATLALGQQGPYLSAFETREQNPLDPNQNLLAPAWWGLQYNSNAPWVTASAYGNVSKSAAAFMDHFGPCLIDPWVLSQGTPAPSPANYWDRSTSAEPRSTGSLYYRRAFYSRFLIVSAGPDRWPGNAVLGVNYKANDERSTVDTPAGQKTPDPGRTTGFADITVPNLLIESQGGRVDPVRATGKFGQLTLGAGGRNDTTSQLEYYGQDDLTNQTLTSTGGALK